MSDLFSAFDSNDQNGEDPAVAAFLAREKVELDKIENQSSFSNDDFSAFSSNIPTASSNIFGDEFTNGQSNISNVNNFTTNSDAFFNASDSTISQPNFTLSNDQFDNFNVSSNLNGGQFGDNESNEKPSAYSAISQVDKLQQEPEKLKKWREEQRERIEKKDKEEEIKKKEWKEIAKKELEDWYKNRQEQLEKTKANNKAAEAEFCAQRDSLVSGQEWDRVSKLCDFNPKANKNTKDVSRMRSILLQLKQQPLIRNK